VSEVLPQLSVQSASVAARASCLQMLLLSGRETQASSACLPKSLTPLATVLFDAL
jgi:hypothetical protein